MITRRVAKRTQSRLSGLLPDPILLRQNAMNSAKAICVYTTANSQNRRVLLKQRIKDRAIACEMKRGNVFVCGYVTKNDTVVKPYCRRKARK